MKRQTFMPSIMPNMKDTTSSMRLIPNFLLKMTDLKKTTHKTIELIKYGLSRDHVTRLGHK